MKLSAFFLDLAGSDRVLLSKSPWSEQQKHAYTGLVVAIICLLSFITSTYSLIFLFVPQSEATTVESAIKYATCGIIGFVWSLIVFNLYRFIVSSTGFGDGTDRLRLPEMVNAGVKLGLITLIALSGSIPIGVLLLHDQMHSTLSGSQIQTLEELDRNIDRLYSDKLNQLYQDQAHAIEQVKLESAKLLNWERSIASQPAMKGSHFNERTNQIFEEQRQELKSQIVKHTSTLNSTRIGIKILREEMRQKKTEAESELRRTDSLLSETKTAFEQHRPLMYFIILFMWLVHSIPILLQNVYVKGPYEYQVECQNSIVLTKNGIAPESEIITYMGRNYPVRRYMKAERISESIRKYYASQRESARQRIQAQSESARKSLLSSSTVRHENITDARS